MHVFSVNPVFLKSTENQNPPAASTTYGGVVVINTEGYLRQLADDGYDNDALQSNKAAEDSGYLAVIDGSPGPEPSYIVPLPSPTSPNGDASTEGYLRHLPDDDYI